MDSSVQAFPPPRRLPVLKSDRVSVLWRYENGMRIAMFEMDSTPHVLQMAPLQQMHGIDNSTKESEWISLESWSIPDLEIAQLIQFVDGSNLLQQVNVYDAVFAPRTAQQQLAVRWCGALKLAAVREFLWSDRPRACNWLNNDGETEKHRLWSHLHAQWLASF